MLFPLNRRLAWRLVVPVPPLKAAVFVSLTLCGAGGLTVPDAVAREPDHQSNVSLRLRYGLAESGPVAGKTASAAFTWHLNSVWSEQLSSRLELNHVHTAFDDDYNDGREMNDQPVIPDVASTELKQLALAWDDGVNRLLLGRQRLELDGQRFIGSNNFWQNDQTLDALSYRRAWMFSSAVRYSYVHRAHRIFATNGVARRNSDNSRNAYRLQPGQHDHNSHLLHLSLKDWDYQDISLFYYDIEIDQQPLLGNRTVGGRYQYERRWGGLKPSLTLSLADQTRPDSGQSVHIPYYLLQLQLAAPSRAVAVRHEVLGSRKGLGLVTPLADLHAFQGWADAFNGQPGTGIRDTSIKLLWRDTPLRLDLRQHWFERDADGAFLGRETDLDVLLKINRQQRLLLRYARFSPANAAQNDRVAAEQRLFFSYRLHF